MIIRVTNSHTSIKLINKNIIYPYIFGLDLIMFRQELALDTIKHKLDIYDKIQWK